MRLTLGGRTVDLATRALVVAPLDAGGLDASGLEALCREAERLVASGADIVEVTGDGVDPGVMGAAVAALVGAGVGPVAVAATDLAVVRAAYQAGAVLGPLPVRDLPRRPVTSEEPMLVAVDGPAAAAVAVAHGCRLLRTGGTGTGSGGTGGTGSGTGGSGGPDMVRALRRVCDVLAAVLEA